MFVRTITLGLDPVDENRSSLGDLVPAFFTAATAEVEASGRSLRTRRVVLPPLNGRPRFSRANQHAVLRWVCELAKSADVRWINAPFTCFVDGSLEPSFEAALDVVKRFDNIFVNIIVAQNGQIHRPGILRTAGFIQDVARLSPNGYDNFRVGASCNVSANGPFFPFTYHDGTTGFSLALELPALFHSVLDENEGKPLQEVTQALCQALVGELNAVNEVGQSIEKTTGVRYIGVDSSLAPYPDDTGSVAALLERMGVAAYGTSGTLFLTAALTDCLRNAVSVSGVRSIGFNGVMDSLLEDPAIAVQGSQRVLTIDSLLAFASVCGCGLDMVPIPGDVYREEIASLIVDVAAMSCALGKPLGARLLPIPGKRANEFTDFGHDFFYNCRVLDVRNRALNSSFFQGGPFALEAPLRTLE